MILLAVLLLLSSCATNNKEVVPLTHETLNEELFDEDRLNDYLLKRGDDLEDYYLGNGIRPFDLDGSVLNEEIYSVFKDDVIILIIVKDNEVHYFDNEVLLKNINNNPNSLIIKTSTGLCYLSEDEMIPFEENAVIDQKDTETMKEIREKISETNPLNTRKRKIEVKDHKSRYTARITVRFTSDDEDEKAKKFEDFCKGKLLNRMKSTPLYVYEIGYDNEKALKKLLEDCAALEYVKTVQIDGQSELIDPVKEKE